MKGGMRYILSGYAGYHFPTELSKRIPEAAFIPKAFLSWNTLDKAPAAPAVDLESPVDTSEMTGHAGRSAELLGIKLHWNISKEVGKWNQFEVPIEVAPGKNGLSVSFECFHLLGEARLSDLTLIPQGFSERVLRDGAYRFLPSNEFTYPLKKMILLGDTYRNSLLSFPPSSFSFDLEMPAKPVLEFYTGLIAERGNDEKNEAVFTVTGRILEGAGAKNGSRTIHTSSMDTGSGESSWKRVSIGLPGYARKRARLTFEVSSSQPSDKNAKPTLAPFWGTPVLYDSRASSSRPSILLLTIDCTREDRLGAHGYLRNCTPNLDALAKRSIDFLNAYTPSDYTYVVMPMLMTGRMIKFDWIGSLNELDLSILSLPEILIDNGYLAAGFCADYYFNGFWKGFPSRPFFDNMEHLKNDELLLEDATKFILSHPDTPLFTWIHLSGPHPPCPGNPPDDVYIIEEGLEQEMKSLFDLSGLNKRRNRWTAIHKLLYGEHALSPENTRTAVELANALYDGQLKRTDRIVGGFLDRLTEEGVLDSTLLAVTSDHGIQLKKEDLYARGPLEDGLRIPLLLSGPGLPSESRRIEERVSTIDLMPTILDLLGIPSPSGITGQSLLPYIENKGMQQQAALFGMLTGWRTVWFDDLDGEYKYMIKARGLDSFLEPGADPEGPPIEMEFLYKTSPGGQGEKQDLKKEKTDITIRARKMLIDFWNSLDSSSSQGPVNQALAEFFKKAGYMK